MSNIHREIHYWLVQKSTLGRNPRPLYYCLTPAGEATVTPNVKLAMRWSEEDGAAQAVQRLGSTWWTAIKVGFPGNELCGIPSRLDLLN